MLPIQEEQLAHSHKGCGHLTKERAAAAGRLFKGCRLVKRQEEVEVCLPGLSMTERESGSWTAVVPERR